MWQHDRALLITIAILMASSMIPTLGMSLEHTTIAANTWSIPPSMNLSNLSWPQSHFLSMITSHTYLFCHSHTSYMTTATPTYMTTVTPTYHDHTVTPTSWPQPHPHINIMCPHNVQSTRRHFCVPQFQIRASTLKTALFPRTWAIYQVCIGSKFILISAHCEVSFMKLIHELLRNTVSTLSMPSVKEIALCRDG